MLSSTNRAILTTIAVVLFIPIVLLQMSIDPQRHQFEPGNGRTQAAVGQLPFEFALGALTGFREAVAGLLWVRADDFFDKGDYAAVVPLVRIITWLDPHNVDVYETGAWHMDYNFTDQSNRSDRRYLPLAIALMNEAIANNPRSIDLYADLGYTHYFRKLEDSAAAITAFQQGQDEMQKILQEAAAHPNDYDLQQEAQAAAQNVTTLSHGLAHGYEAMGNIPAAEKQLALCVQMYQYNLAHHLEDKFGQEISMSNTRTQLQEMQYRAKYRPAEEKIPCDMGFDAQLIRTGPKVFVAQGTLKTEGALSFDFKTGQATWGPINGSRIEIRIEDLGYKLPRLASLSMNNLALDPNLSIMQDSVSVRDGKFQKIIDMSKDPDMYGFTGDKYLVTFWFNPSYANDCPINVQDRIGWLGEAMVNNANPKLLDSSGNVPATISGPVPGLKILKKTFILTRADILGTTRKVFE